MSDRIDLIVVRDPDFETQTEMFVNGKPLQYPNEFHFDPGAGYTYREYVELGEDVAAADLPQAVKDRLVALHDEMLPTYRRWATDSCSNWPTD